MTTIEQQSFKMNLRGIISLIAAVGIIVSAYFMKSNAIQTQINATQQQINDVSEGVKLNIQLQLQYRATDSLKYQVIQLQLDQLKNDIDVDRAIMSITKK